MMNACVGDEGLTELPGVAGVTGHWFPSSCAALCATHLVNENFRSHLYPDAAASSTCGISFSECMDERLSFNKVASAELNPPNF